MGENIRIEGPPEVLEDLRRELIEEIGDSAEIQPLSTAIPGELREPVLVALLVPSAAVTIRTIGSVIERRMTHAERLELIRVYREKDGEELSFSDLLASLTDD